MIPPGYTLISRAYDRFSEIDAKQAFGWLKWHLIRGDLLASTFDSEEEQKIAKGHWRHRTDEDLSAVFKTANRYLDPLINQDDQDPSKAVVRTDVLESLLALRRGLPTIPTAKDIKTRGAPPRYAEFLIEAFMVLVHAKKSEIMSALDLRKATMKALSERGMKHVADEISEDQARSLCKALFDRWKTGD